MTAILGVVPAHEAATHVGTASSAKSRQEEEVDGRMPLPEMIVDDGRTSPKHLFPAAV
jgi:hypothetical protein